MSIVQIIVAIGGVLTTLGFGALGGYLFYKRKHPVDLESGQVANIKDWQGVYPDLVRHVQEISHAQIEQLKTEFKSNLKEAQEQERIDCDAKIKQVKDDLNKEIKKLNDRAKTAEDLAAKNQKIIEAAEANCPQGCFYQSNQRA